MGILLGEWLLFLALAWYLEQVLPSGTGVRRHPLFFLPFKWQPKVALTYLIRFPHPRNESDLCTGLELFLCHLCAAAQPLRFH